MVRMWTLMAKRDNVTDRKKWWDPDYVDEDENEQEDGGQEEVQPPTQPQARRNFLGNEHVQKIMERHFYSLSDDTLKAFVTCTIGPTDAFAVPSFVTHSDTRTIMPLYHAQQALPTGGLLLTLSRELVENAKGQLISEVKFKSKKLSSCHRYIWVYLRKPIGMFVLRMVSFFNGLEVHRKKELLKKQKPLPPAKPTVLQSMSKRQKKAKNKKRFAWADKIAKGGSH